MTNYLKTFAPGDEIKASETNSNNQYLLDEITNSAGAISADVTTKLALKADLTLSNVTSLSSAIQTLINAKYAKIDLSNLASNAISTHLTTTDKANIVAYGMPNFATASYIAITPSASGTYTAPNSGYISLIFKTSDNDPVYKVYIDNKQIYQFSRGGDYGGGRYNTLFCTIDKGSVLKWDLTQCDTSGSIWHFIKSNNG